MTDGEAGTIVFRGYSPEDVPFLHSSWAESYLSGVSAHRGISPDVFHSFHRPIRERFFSKPNATCIICSPDDDPWLIMGWIAVEALPTGLILHYLYVKDAFKRQGIATALIKRALPLSPVYYTHLTERAARIMARKQERLAAFKYVPHLV